MPLEAGKSDETKGQNISELMRSWEKTGKIGSSDPASKEKAHKQPAPNFEIFPVKPGAFFPTPGGEKPEQEDYERGSYKGNLWGEKLSG